MLYIQKESYNFNKLVKDFYELFSNTICPACRQAGSLKKHAKYKKYYYSEHIHIFRCLCTYCRTTHAIIPSFSLPGTTVGTEEVEEYLESWENRGFLRRWAGKQL